MQIQNSFARVIGSFLIVFTFFTFAAGASAQNLYQLKFKGTTATVDAAGNEKVHKLTDKMLVQEWVKKAGIAYDKNMVLAFHRNVDSRGDAIEVVNRRDGSHVVTVFPLFFPETASASTSRNTTEKRFAYLYNLHQSEYSRGTAIFNQQTILNKKGQTNRFVVSGEMQWYQLPEATERLRIRVGTFKATKAIR